MGLPKAIWIDQGAELVSRGSMGYQRRVTLDFSRPDLPTLNTFMPNLNAKSRAEWLNARWFMSLDDGPATCKTRRRD